MNLISSILSFLLRNFYLTLVAVFAIYFWLKPETKTIINVTNYSYEKQEVKKDDPRIYNLWDQGNVFIINNSNSTIFLESVEYSSNSYQNSYDPVTIKIRGNSTYPSKNNVNYIFSEPPNSISVSSSAGKTTRWHLRR